MWYQCYPGQCCDGRCITRPDGAGVHNTALTRDEAAAIAFMLNCAEARV